MAITHEPLDPEIAALEARADKLLREHRERCAMPSILYHYTSLHAARNILNTLDIWCTNSSCSLDEEEAAYAEDVFARVASENADPVSGYFVNRMIDVSTKTVSYLTCFSSAPDLANQWRDYADQGPGAAIGVDAAVLSQRNQCILHRLSMTGVGRNNWSEN